MNWRSPKLLDKIKKASKAGEAPCFWPIPHPCSRHQPGSVVYMHSNQGRDGKGRSIKAHDYRIALGCYWAHMGCDQGKLHKITVVSAWEDAHRETIGWLIENGILGVK